MTLKLRQCSTSHCRSAFNLLWYAFEYALDAGVVLPTWKELVNVSTSRVSRISKSAVNVWVKEIKSICQVKGQPEIIHPVKNQSKYLVSQAFDRGRRSEYMIYRNATPLSGLVAYFDFSSNLVYYFRYLTKTLLYRGKQGTVPSRASIRHCEAVFLHSFIIRGTLNRNAKDKTNKEPHYFAGQASK